MIKEQNNKKISCAICGAKEFKPLYTITKSGFTFQVVKCKKCNVQYLNPRPTQKKITALYDEDYFHGKGFDTGVNYVESMKYREGWEYIHQDRMTTIEKYSKEGTIIDIGCGFGEFLATAKKRGWNTLGIELSSYSAKIARKKSKINVYCGTLEHAKCQKEKCSVITMFEVIEHLEDPSKTLKECHRILNNNGIIIIQTGDVDSLSAKIAGKNWQYYLAGHLIYFSRDTLKKLLEKNGFKVIKIYSGDEIGLSARSKLYWCNKKKSNIFAWINYGIFMSMHIIRKLGFGGMCIYAKKV